MTQMITGHSILAQSKTTVNTFSLEEDKSSTLILLHCFCENDYLQTLKFILSDKSWISMALHSPDRKSLETK